MNISLEPELKDFASGESVRLRGFSTASEYVRHLIRMDRERQLLRQMLEAGLESGPPAPVDEAFFQELRSRLEGMS